jgi:hypothetical protein
MLMLTDFDIALLTWLYQWAAVIGIPMIVVAWWDER